jgi:hypothetical protein
MADLLEMLERTRPEYDRELEYHRMLVDAYTGGGGFAGAVLQPLAGFWGSASEVFGSGTTVGTTGAIENRITYLDRYPREDEKKFKRRLEIAHYPNYIQPLTDLKLSYMLRKDWLIEGRAPALDVWREDVDGRGTPWDEVLPMVALRAATLGWCPVVVDMPPTPVNEDGSPLLLNRAVADQLGLRPSIIPLFPSNLVDYQLDDYGNPLWAKIRTDHVEQADPFAPVMEITRYTIWYPDSFETFEVIKNADGGKMAQSSTGRTTHSFGTVPIAILRHKPTLEDPVKGIPMHGQESVEARRLFNLHSELDEHMRSQVFALLVLAMGIDEAKRQVTIGTDNAVLLDPMANRNHYFMAPPASVAESYEKRIESSIQEIYRQAHVEFTRPESSRQAVSGIARKFEFAQTNSSLAVFAKEVARFEERIDTLVGRVLGVSEEALGNTQITAPTSFDVEDLTTDLQVAIDAITGLSIGPTAESRLRARIVDQLMPNLSKSDQEKIEEELEDIEAVDLDEKQMQEEVDAALAEEEDDEEEDQAAE